MIMINDFRYDYDMIYDMIYDIMIDLLLCSWGLFILWLAPYFPPLLVLVVVQSLLIHGSWLFLGTCPTYGCGSISS